MLSSLYYFERRGQKKKRESSSCIDFALQTAGHLGDQNLQGEMKMGQTLEVSLVVMSRSRSVSRATLTHAGVLSCVLKGPILECNPKSVIIPKDKVTLGAALRLRQWWKVG